MEQQTKETTGATLVDLASDELTLPDGFEYERPALEEFRYSSVLGGGVSRCDAPFGGDDQCEFQGEGSTDPA